MPQDVGYTSKSKVTKTPGKKKSKILKKAVKAVKAAGEVLKDKKMNKQVDKLGKKSLVKK